MMMSGVFTVFFCDSLNSCRSVGMEALPRMLMEGRLFGLLPFRLSIWKLMEASMFFNVCSRFWPRYMSSCSSVTVATEPV